MKILTCEKEVFLISGEVYCHPQNYTELEYQLERKEKFSQPYEL